MLVMLTAVQAHAQRPIRAFDPFYLGESATRGFYDSYAVSAEVSYFPTAFVPTSGASGTEVPATADQLGLNLRIEYHLASQLDLGVYIDAAGNTAGRSLDLSWISLKYFQRYENVDYAIRLAVDPASNGGAGFPQMDLGFLYHTTHSSTVASEYALGIRRVQMGFQQIVETIPPPLGQNEPIIKNPGPERELLRSQALGWEVHLKGGYSVLFDPAGSNLFVSVMGEGGSYELIEWAVSGDDVAGTRSRREFSGGVVWLRTGIQLNRPTFVVSPHISLPVKQWAPESGDDWPRTSAYVGVSFTIR